MTREFYNELLNKKLITDTKMSYEYIQKHNIPLCEIITIPAQLEKYLNNAEPVVEETVVEETVVEETVEETVEEIVVDEPEVEEKPKAKKN